MQRPRHRKTSRIESDTSWAHGSQARDLRTLPLEDRHAGDQAWLWVSTLQLHLPAWCTEALRGPLGTPRVSTGLPVSLPTPGSPLHHVSISMPGAATPDHSASPAQPKAAAHPTELTLISPQGPGDCPKDMASAPQRGLQLYLALLGVPGARY